MVIDVIKNRRSVRNFKDFPISDELIHEIIKAAQFAPTANNNQGIEYIIVRDSKMKQQLFEISEPKQEFVKDAPVIIIPIIDTNKTRLPIQDLSLASENIFLQATSMGLGSVWKNFFPPIAENVQKLLNLPANYMLINAIPIGYPKSSPVAHKEEDFRSEKIHNEQF